MEETCPHCNLALSLGVSLNGSDSAPDRALIDPPPIPANHQTFRLTDVLKCPQCGYSIRENHDHADWKANNHK